MRIWKAVWRLTSITVELGLWFVVISNWETITKWMHLWAYGAAIVLLIVLLASITNFTTWITQDSGHSLA